MPKLPRDLSGRDVARALERGGFVCTRRVGSHFTYRRGDRVTTVPMHRFVKVGTLRSILRDVGLPIDEFKSLL